ncbi:CDP-alcohol phosphatidyltransferase family protein [Rubripirellula sp.]|nr:CDP-alcohol phosphatidyltransferase family protein [Rubripirellula sp.]MDB4639345.1 CDP-alcohol phosphatidyltransferase family protein [bacterium]
MNSISLQNIYHLTYRNLANVASILGVLPLCLLFGSFGDVYLIPLIIYCNVMDDLDGILAAKLKIGSEFGARLDNVCDAVSHSIILMFVGMAFGGICTTAALVAISVVVLRSVSRLDPTATPGTGSPTNELVRHVFFILLLSEQFAFDGSPYLIVAFVLNAITMALPWKLPFMIRGMTKSAVAIGLVNVALVVAWLVPNALSIIAAAFIGTYLYSFGWALLTHSGSTSPAEPQ